MPKRGDQRKAKENWWRATVERWKASGLTQAEFCRREGLQDWSLSEWRRRLARIDAADRGRRTEREKPSIEFAPVTVQDVLEPGPVPDRVPAHGWEVIVIRIPAIATSPDSVKTVLEALRWTC